MIERIDVLFRKQRQVSAPVNSAQLDLLREDLKSKKAQRESQRQQQRENFAIHRTVSDPFSLRQPISVRSQILLVHECLLPLLHLAIVQ